MLFIKLALRNLFRNRVRTLLNLSMVVGAFAAIVLFKGFSNTMMRDMEHVMTNGFVGHVQIATQGVWDGESGKDKEATYLANHVEIAEKVSTVPHVLKVSGRANVPVLLSSGDKTIGALAVGFNPAVEDNIEKTLITMAGEPFSKKNSFEVLVGMGLQKSLQLQVGQTLTVVSQTLSGSMSSLDLEVRGIVATSIVEVDNTTVYIPLEAAQKLLGTNRVEKMTILLKPDTDLIKAKSDIQDVLSSDKNAVVKDWKETAVLFQQVDDFYTVQNLVVEIILSVLVFLGILNTVGMSIYERIGEIGTMKALGDQNSEVITLFLCEGLLLGLLGVALGVPVSALLAGGFNSLGVISSMPGASVPVPITMNPELKDFIEAGVAVVLTCFISTIWPTLKAMRLSIVDALRANS